jgi:hypothetical protein
MPQAAEVAMQFVLVLSAADPEVDREATAPHCSRRRSLSDDAAAERSPGANAAHAAD